jgi:hypothetical protein
MTVFNLFKDGDLVIYSGVYSALHSTPHKLVERATYFEGERFESCRLCPLGVIYRVDEPLISIAPKSSSIPMLKEKVVTP